MGISMPSGTKSNKLFRLILFFLLVCILQNMQIWPAVYFSSKTITYLCIIALFVISGIASRRVHKGLLFSFLLIFADNFFLDGFASLPQLLPYVTGILLFQLSDERKQETLTYVTKVLSYIIIVSLIVYIVWMVVGFSPIGVLRAPFNYQDHHNYFFFIMPAEEFFLINRFRGPFIEPGHLGSIAVYLLYANNFNFKEKKYLWFLVAGILFSLSLAAYLLLAVAILLRVRVKVGTILLLALSFLCFNYIVTDMWNNGDNPVNEMIYARLEYDEQTEDIAGNNRTSALTDSYYESFVKSGEIIFGKGSNFMGEMFKNGSIMGAGYKMFFMQFGIIGTIIVFFYYFFIAKACPDKRFAYGFLILYAVSFLQRAYPYWLAWMLPYVCSMNMINLQKKIPIKQ